MKISHRLTIITLVIVSSSQILFAQKAAEFKEFSKLVVNATSGEEVSRISADASKLESKITKPPFDCDAIFEAIDFRLKTHRKLEELPVIPIEGLKGLNAEQRQRLAERLLVINNLTDEGKSRIDELFLLSETACHDKRTDMPAIRARVHYAWLQDNFEYRSDKPPSKSKQNEQRITILENYKIAKDLLTAKDDSFKGEMYEISLLYSDALFRFGRFEDSSQVTKEVLAGLDSYTGDKSYLMIFGLRLERAISVLAMRNDDAEPIFKQLESLGDTDLLKSEQNFFDISDRLLPEYVDKARIKHGRTLLEGMAELRNYNQAVKRSFGRTRNISVNMLKPGTVNAGIIVSYRTQGIPMLIQVDEAGVVTSVDVQFGKPKLRRKLTKIAMELRFEPLVYKGQKSKMKGIVYLWHTGVKGFY